MARFMSQTQSALLLKEIYPMFLRAINVSICGCTVVGTREITKAAQLNSYPRKLIEISLMFLR
jgi:hypothetical protein